MPCDFVIENWTFESSDMITLAIRFFPFLRDFFLIVVVVIVTICPLC
jgi:hypothetical protein